jgi:predicted DNA-binding transcriptional regulator YafY
MKADRLVAALLLLQTRGKVTAAELAEELEISERTARRDLEALSAAGIPVYAQAGRNGGWALLGGARTDLTGLTADEARAMFMVAGPAAAATPELKAALRKLVRALPEPFRQSAQTAANSIVIDPGHWGRSGKSFQPKHLNALQTAVVTAVQVRLGYSDRTGKSTTRVVHPLGLVVKGSVWYLIAGTDAGQRTFKVGRVTSVELTTEPSERPADFDLGAAWEQIAANIEDMRSPHHIEALVDADIVPVLRWMFDRQLTVLTADQPGTTGRVPVRIGGHSVERLAQQLAGWGSHIEITAPPAARAVLAQVGTHLVATYGSD